MLKQKPQDISFDSGIVHFYRQQNTAAPGNMPKPTLTHLATLRYRRKTVGISRYYTAMQNSQKISEVIRCPLVPLVDVTDTAEIAATGVKYIVRQVQYPEGTTLPVMDIALERLE